MGIFSRRRRRAWWETISTRVRLVRRKVKAVRARAAKAAKAGKKKAATRDVFAEKEALRAKARQRNEARIGLARQRLKKPTPKKTIELEPGQSYRIKIIWANIPNYDAFERLMEELESRGAEIERIHAHNTESEIARLTYTVTPTREQDVTVGGRPWKHWHRYAPRLVELVESVQRVRT